MANKLPAITGNELIKLLQSDGWEPKGYSKGGHTIKLRKKILGDRTLTTMVQPINKPLTDSTLGQILGPLQTRLGHSGLEELIERNRKK